MTSAMLPARSGVDKAMDMSVLEFFDKYCKIMSDNAEEELNQSASASMPGLSG